MSDALTCRDLRFSRGSKEILKGISLAVKDNSLTGLIGHNGAGKSTLIKLFLGLLQPQSGELSVLGGHPSGRLLQIGYLPENVSFYDNMTIDEHLRYFAKLKKTPASRADELVETLGIAHVRSQKLGKCSKGQRQRLGLAQALLSNPRILFLDEPTVGLDPEATALMYQELVNLKNLGCTVVVCTHELSLLEDFVDDVVVLSEGEKKGQGTIDALRELAGLPAVIRFEGSVEGLERDERLKPYLRGAELCVPEGGLKEVFRMLARDHDRFDFQVRKAGLLEIYGKLVGRQIGVEPGRRGK